MYSNLVDKYGKVMLIYREQNVVQMKKCWDPSDPIKTMFAQLNDANKYSISSGTSLQEHNLLQAGETLILWTGQFSQEYKDWHALPDAAKIWTHFQALSKKPM